MMPFTPNNRYGRRAKASMERKSGPDMTDDHDFESKIVGYEKPSEPQWVQDIVRCYQPPIIKWTCKKCGYSFQGRSSMFFMRLEMGLPPCTGSLITAL